MKVPSTVGEQPKGQETIKGAIARAFACIGTADYGIGLEAGVFETEQGLYDVQYCAVIDKRGMVTIGHGPGVQISP